MCLSSQVHNNVNELRNALFISYASEDIEYAEWLGLKLTSEGYEVVWDRGELLGGEDFILDIDDLMKNRSFRVLQLYSRHSAKKRNTVSERTLALSLGTQRKVPDFFIPLRRDSEPLTWEIASTNYIPFENLFAGLSQLLRKLDKVSCPRHQQSIGRANAALMLQGKNIVVPRQTKFYTNCFPITGVPKALFAYRLVASEVPSHLSQYWPHVLTDSNKAVSFLEPPHELRGNYKLDQTVDIDFYMDRAANGRNDVVNLLRQHIEKTIIEKQMVKDAVNDMFYFPKGLLENDKLLFTGYAGKATWKQVYGVRSYYTSDKDKVELPYHIGLRFKIVQFPLGQFAVRILPDFHFIDKLNNPVVGKRRNARRKALTKSWHNHEYLQICIALAAYLGTKPEVQIADAPPTNTISFSKFPVSISSDSDIDEDAILSITKEAPIDRTQGDIIT